MTPRGVTTDDGVLTSRAVVVATDPGTAGMLLPGLDVPVMRNGTTWWPLADAPGAALGGGRPILVVDPDRRGPIVNSVVVSNAAPAYSRDGRALVASTAIGTDSLDERDARDHLTLLHGTDTIQGALVSGRRIADAVLAALA